MHTIRLRAAWRSDGRVHTRRFNRPTGLDDGERVWLALDDASSVAGATLNGAPIHFSASGRCNVTGLLSPSNCFVVETEQNALLESVRLEIEPPPKG